jgi:hypothetical protein
VLVFGAVECFDQLIVILCPVFWDGNITDRQGGSPTLARRATVDDEPWEDPGKV